MKGSKSFINNKKDNKPFQQNAKLLNNLNKIKELSRQIQPNFLQMYPLKNKSFFVNNKIDNNVLKNISYKNTSNNKNQKPKNKKIEEVNHRPSISTDFSLSLEFGNLMNINNNNENENNEKNLNENQNKLIKVNTKRNNYKNNLSLRSQFKTNKKHNINKNNNFETNELFKNLSEINIFNNINKTNKNILKYKYDIKKIIIIQKWWKTLFLIRKSQCNSIIFLIKSIKKKLLFNPYLILKKTFPSISYYFHKWNRIVTKQKIIKQFIKKNTNKIKKVKKDAKVKNKNNKISQKIDINKNNLDSLKNTKKSSKNNKKSISISTNTNNAGYSKTNEKNKYCQTTKFNSINNKTNYINFNLPLNNNKNRIPNSPKSNLITERYTSPTNNLRKKSQTKKSSLSKNNNKKVIKKNEEKNKIEKQTPKIKSNIITNKGKKRKIFKKSIETKIEKKLNSKLNNIISHNNSISKNEIQSVIEEGISEIKSNPNSQFNNYIINISKKRIELTPHYYNYSKDYKNENKIINDEHFNVKINNKNNKSQYTNTEENHNIINVLFKTQLSKSNTKTYDNHLNRGDKNKNFPFQEKKECFKLNNNIDNKKYKKNKCIPINKNIILHKKDKKKLSANKEFSNHKMSINYNLTNNTSNAPFNETNTTLTKVNSIENNSNKTINTFKNRNLLKSIYFDMWKEHIDKKLILQKFIKFSKFIEHIKHYKKIISLKNSIQELIKLSNKEQFYQYILKIVYKMIINIFNKIFIYKSNNTTRKIKIWKKINNNKYPSGKEDILKNINKNNYIHNDDYDLIRKRKAKSPNLFSKVIEYKTNNNSYKYDYYNKKRHTLATSNSDKFINICRHYNKNNINKNCKEEIITVEINEEENEKGNNNHKNNKLLKINNSGYLNNKIVKNNVLKGEKGVIIDQINQLKMVFNLIERHNKIKSNKKFSLFDCFNKWKLYSFNKIKNFEKIAVPRISEKIINLKPFQTSQIINNEIENNRNNLPLKKNFSLSKMSPKIINVINVQNFNENNNYNYNFKYMPIKDIPIYPRHSFDYNNINNMNNNISNIAKNNINENKINTNMNNNINATSFLMLNENKSNNSNMVYHKKKLGPNFINNNYNFNFNNNIDNLVNNSNYNNCYYNIDSKGNYNNSSFLFLEQNQSQILLPPFSNRIYNLDNNNNINFYSIPSSFRDNSLKDFNTCIINKEHHPEIKFGFKKLNKIEEKEINFDNINNQNKPLYVKKPHFEGKKTKTNNNNTNNIKINNFTENIEPNNLIKCLNVQFGKINKEINKKNRLSKNKIYASNKCITITEDNFDKNKINDKKVQVSLRKKSFKQIYCKILVGNENKINSDKRNETVYKLNKNFSLKNFTNTFNYKKIKNKKRNHSFEIYSNNKKNKISINNNNITM